MRNIRAPLYLILAFSLFPGWIKADSPPKDSLFKVWENQSFPDTSRMAALRILIQDFYLNKFPDSAEYLAGQMKNQAIQSGNLYYQALGEHLQGNAIISQGNVNQGLIHQREALRIWAELDAKKELARVYFSIAVIEVNLGAFDSALVKTNQGLDMLSPIEDTISYINFLTLQAIINHRQGNVLAALEINENILDICRKETSINNTGPVTQGSKRDLYERKEVVVLQNLADNFKDLGDYSNASRNYLLARAIYQKRNHALGEVQILKKMAHLSTSLGESKKAKEYLDELFELTSKHNFPRQEAENYLALGDWYISQSRFDEGIETLQKGLELIEQKGIGYFRADAEMKTGYAYLKKEDLNKAEQYFSTGIEEYKKRKNLPKLLMGYVYQNELYIKQGKWEQAKQISEEGFHLAQKNNQTVFVEDFSKELARIYKHVGNTAEALRLYEIYIAVRDSMYNEKNTRDRIEQEYLYDYEIKVYQDSLQNIAKEEMQAATLQRRTQANWFLGGILALIAGFSLLLFNRFRLTRKQKQTIEEERNKLDIANEKLKEADLSKSRFFTNISHEFRTPLTVILGMTDRIADMEPRNLIKRNSQQLLKLINQILDLRSLESGNMQTNYQQEDVISYLSYILESFHSYAEEKEVSLSFETEVDGLIMDVDEEKLLSVVSNLLSNAVKFTPKGGEVQMKVYRKQKGAADYLHFSVEDTGVGIAPEKLPYIFDRFYQVNDGASQQGEGTGIGLTLAKELIQVMGGEITAVSQPGQGTRFEVSLPINHTSPETALPPRPVLEQSHPEPLESIAQTPSEEELPSVLIVEDNADVVRYLLTCLQDQYQVSIAKDGQEGIEKAIEEVPDLIISDVMMPRKDGFELCQTLKTDERTSHIPIVLLTAKADFDSKLTGLDLGADVYLAKPFDKQELLIQLRNLIAVRKQLQQRYQSGEPLAPADNPITQKQDAFILRAKEILEAQLDNPEFNIPAFCKEIGMSRTQLHRKMKALTDLSTSHFIQNFRLEKAYHLLETTDLNIAEISDMTGHSSPNYFSNLFKKKYGMTPGQTRKGS